MSSNHLHTLPAAVHRRVARHSAKLQKREVAAVRLTPLILTQDIQSVLKRRSRVFSACSWEKTAFGWSVEFSRRLRPGPGQRKGRVVQGQFDIAVVNARVSIILSELSSEPNKYGPDILAERAYPIAVRPLIQSAALGRLIENMAEQNEWRAMAVDAIGYDGETHEFRRDMKSQTVSDAMGEMREQRRYVHRVKVRFRDAEDHQVLVAAFDRHGAARVYQGNLLRILSEFVIPAIDEALSSKKAYEVKRSVRPLKQSVLQVKFAEEQFSTYDDMKTLCGAVARQRGLNVAAIHINPYLQAQILDFLTGAAVDMLVTDDHTVSLIPRSGECPAALERIVNSILRFFGEGTVRQAGSASA